MNLSLPQVADPKDVRVGAIATGVVLTLLFSERLLLDVSNFVFLVFFTKQLYFVEIMYFVCWQQYCKSCFGNCVFLLPNYCKSCLGIGV
jgi:hypothetical protein